MEKSHSRVRWISRLIQEKAGLKEICSAVIGKEDIMVSNIA
jgi:hypothetical protein